MIESLASKHLYGTQIILEHVILNYFASVFVGQRAHSLLKNYHQLPFNPRHQKVAKDLVALHLGVLCVGKHPR
jgi:hypothetical protein